MSRKSGGLGDWLVYWLYRLWLAKISILPRPLARAICRGLAGLFYRFDLRHRRIGMTNLAIAFPEKSEQQRIEILRESFLQLGDHAVELSRLHLLGRDTVKGWVEYEPGRGLENYRLAKEQHDGVIFVTAHVGPWELLPAAHAVMGAPLTFVVRPLDNPFLDRWSRSLRASFGNQVVDKHRAMRPLLKKLRAGEDVGILIDQNVQETEGVFVPFFGQPASSTTAPAVLALRTGLPVIAGFIYPYGNGSRYRIRFYPPRRYSGDPSSHSDLERVTAELQQLVEETIRDYPCHWLWGHRRYSTQPDGRQVYHRN